MKLAAIPLVALLATTVNPRSGCGSGERPYVPCEGKACGESCRSCPPDAPDCVETAVVKACDPAGRCVPQTPDLCAASGACAGKACGTSCVWDPPCRSATPPCMAPSYLGHCGADGACVAGAFAGCAPDPACVGKLCGQPCDRCGGLCMNPVATACDYAGRCVPAGPSICVDPCAGKVCGESCSAPCPAPVACDRAGVCSPLPVTCP